MTVKYKLTFDKPYRIGLLLKRSDKLHVNRNLDQDFDGLFLTNITLTEIKTEK